MRSLWSLWSLWSLAASTITARALWMCAVITASAQVGSAARIASTISTWCARLRRNERSS